MNTANRTIDHKRSIISLWSLLACFIVMAASVVLTAPGVYAAPGGGGGKSPGPFVKLSGTVTNSYSGLGIADATVTLTVGNNVIRTLVTDANGEYEDNKAPIGSFTMTTSKANYPDVVEQVYLTKGRVTHNVSMTPNARVIVSATLSGNMMPGDTPTATGSYIILDGSSVVGTNWSQTEGVTAAIGDVAALSTAVTLGSATEYAAHLIDILESPPISAADLPPDLVLQPINQIRKGLQDRYQVVGIYPHAHEEAAAVHLEFAVTTSSGTYTASLNATTDLPWPVSTGVRTVARNQTVLLFAKANGAYNWQSTTAPNGSTAALTDADTQSPWFTPDVVGPYLLTETNSGETLQVYAGGYHGVIDPTLTLNSVNFGDGRPVGDANCTGCHMVGGAAPPNFDTWRNTGHAEAFTQGITTNGHFGENCFACHAVGFGAGGIDSAPGYDAFLADLNAAQHGGDISTLWVSVLTDQPAVARMSNIQCENCHGPQDYTQSHHTPDGTGLGTPRVNLGAETCGSCHGEPARHGRFQQWQLSNHADYDLARSRGASSGNCSRCHSGNGFIAWNQLGFDAGQDVAVTWDADTVVPQVCAACHNPHNTGTTSGSDGTDAKVRVMGDTPVLIAGFAATNVGKGATCMMCHNSRASELRNDANWANLSTSQQTGGPHHGVQADLIMGQNQYFFAPGELVPGDHKLIEDVCVTCHMNATQPPAILSYNQAGTNHTFAADPGICVDCHGLAGQTLAQSVDAEITGYLTTLETELGAAWMRLMEANYPITGTCTADGVTSFITDVTYAYHRGTRLHISVDGVECDNGDEINPSSISGNGTSLQDLALATNTGALYKAAWNYGLNFEDETINGCVDLDDTTCDPPHTHRGVHNHDFSQKGLIRAIQAVQAVAP